MKVNIGPYKEWVGPYQIADILQKVGVSDDRCHKLGERLSKTPLNSICEWVESKRKRKVKIKIHKYDHWNAYTTLAMIILPVLKELHKHKHGAPNIDDSDVPEEYRSSNAPAKETTWDVDENHFIRYDWVLEEMIFAFESIIDDSWEDQFSTGEIDFYFEPCNDGTDCSEMKEGPNHTYKRDDVGWTAYYERIQNGTYLFGKYFQTLWD